MKYDNLIHLRESLNMTQTAFAQSLGINTTTYNNYESGLRDPKSDFWKLVSKKYDVSIDFLLGLTDSPRKVSNSFGLSFSEEEHIKKYRDLDDHGRELIDTILDKELDRCRQEKAPIKLEPEKEEVPPYPVAAFGGIPEGAQDEVSKMLWEFEKKMSDPRFKPGYIDNCSHKDDKE